MDDKIERMAFSVDEAAMRAGLGRDRIYNAIREWGAGRKKVRPPHAHYFKTRSDVSLKVCHPCSCRRQRDGCRCVMSPTIKTKWPLRAATRDGQQFRIHTRREYISYE